MAPAVRTEGSDSERVLRDCRTVASTPSACDGSARTTVVMSRFTRRLEATGSTPQIHVVLDWFAEVERELSPDE